MKKIIPEQLEINKFDIFDENMKFLSTVKVIFFKIKSYVHLSNAIMVCARFRANHPWHGSDMVLNKATYNGGTISYSRVLTLTNWRSYYGQESLGKITSFGISTAMGSKNVVWKITDHQCEHLLPVPECRAVLVRQSIDNFHPANDNLAGWSEYGMAGADTTFSRKFDTWDFDTFIFATKDHQYFQAMTKEALGGSLVSPADYYENQPRNIHTIRPGYSQWEASTSSMYFRSNAREDPWISMSNHWPIETNEMMYGELPNKARHHMQHLQAHGGLQVYVLKKGNYQDCIVDGHVGEFDNGAYVLKEDPYPECEAVLVRQTIQVSSISSCVVLF